MEPFIPEKEHFSIGEASQIAQLPAYTLRYWENEFALLRPQRLESGHRRYTKSDVEIIFKIKELLHKKRYTLEGAKKELQLLKKRESNLQPQPEAKTPAEAPILLQELKKEIGELIKLLD